MTSSLLSAQHTQYLCCELQAINGVNYSAVVSTHIVTHMPTDLFYTFCLLHTVYRELKAACKQLLAEAASGKQASTYAFHAKDVHFGPVHSSGSSSTTAGALRRSSTTAVTATTAAASSFLSAFSRVKSLTERTRHTSKDQQPQQQQHYVTAEVGGYTCRKYECAAEVSQCYGVTHQLY
jgi:hypothetical protein